MYIVCIEVYIVIIMKNLRWLNVCLLYIFINVNMWYIYYRGIYIMGSIFI